MKKLQKGFLIILCILTTVSCILNLSGQPYMVDRTDGWTPSFPEYAFFSIDRFAKTDSFLYSFVFNGSNLQEDSVVVLNLKDSPETNLATALRAAFGEQFKDIGNKDVSITYSGIKAFLTGGETFAVFYRYSGELLQCIDTRIQPQFQKTTYEDFKNGFITLETDIAQLTSKDLEEYAKVATGYDDKYEITEGHALPLTAEGAYNITVNGLYAHHVNKAGSGNLGGIGGAFYVYDLQASDSWAIVGNVFLQVINKTTGKRLLLIVYNTNRDMSSKAP